tara:strand:+ start:238 stop:1092 length:855 start_codon:yes stop_codon:yes gene_type:complete
MSYNHSDPFYWNHVVNVGGFTTPGGLWESVSVNNATQWAIWYLGGPSSGQYIYSIPGCSPKDFSFGGANFSWLADYQGGFGIWSFGTIYSPWSNQSFNIGGHPWIEMRMTHFLMGVTVAEQYHGVGMPGISGLGQNLSPLNAMNQANFFYPQYSNLVNHPISGLGTWSLDRWLEYNNYPNVQIANGNPPNQCVWWIKAFIYYLNKLETHIHAGVPGSYNGIQYNANSGNLSNWWIYKYQRFLSRAHWAQTGSEGCGCGSILNLISPFIFGQHSDPSWAGAWYLP